MNLSMAVAATVVIAVGLSLCVIRRRRFAEMKQNVEKLWREVKEAETEDELKSLLSAVMLSHARGELRLADAFDLIKEILDQRWCVTAAEAARVAARAAKAANDEAEKKILPLTLRVKALFEGGLEPLFEEMHALVVESELSYGDVIKLVDNKTAALFSVAYDRLLVEHLKLLMADAREGTEEAWNEIVRLRDELTDHKYTSFQDKDFVDIVMGLFSGDWDEVVVRYNPAPEEWDFINFDAESYEQMEATIHGARDGNLRSMHYARLLVESGDDDFFELIVEEYEKQLLEAIAAHVRTSIHEEERTGAKGGY